MLTIDAWVAVTVDDDGHCGMGGVLQTQKNETRISRPLRIVQKTESIALYRAIEAAIVSAGHMAAEQLIIHLDAPTIVAAVRDGRPPKGCARYATRIRQQAQHYAVVVTIQYDWGPQMALAHALAHLAVLPRSQAEKQWAIKQNETLIL